MARIDRKIVELEQIDAPVSEDLLVVYDMSTSSGLATKKMRIDQLPSSGGGGTTIVDLVIPIYATEAGLPSAPSTIKFAYVSATNSIYFSNASTWVRLATFMPTDTISGQIEAPIDKTYVLEQRAAYAYNLDGISVVSASGTAQVTLQINGSSVGSLSNIPVSSTPNRVSSPQAGLVPAGARLTMVVSSSSGILDLSFTVETSRLS